MLTKLAIRRQHSILKLPPKTEEIERLDLNDVEKQFYEALFTYCQERVSAILEWIGKRVQQR